jgi:hypothetical protein
MVTKKVGPRDDHHLIAPGRPETAARSRIGALLDVHRFTL